MLGSCYLHVNSPYENFTLPFGRLRQNIAPKSVPHVQHDYSFSFNYSRIPITRTLDYSNLSVTRTYIHFPSSNFVYNFTLDISNNIFQDVTSKKIDKGYSPAGRSVLGKAVPEVLDTQDTRVLKTEGIIFPIRSDLG